MSNIKLKDHNWAAEGIYDTNQSKSQQTINSDVSTKIGQATLQTSSQNLSGATNELKGRADTLDSKYDNVVTVANTQPSSEYNKVWLPLTVSEGTQVPTWAEHQALESSLNDAVSDADALSGAMNSITPFTTVPTINSVKGITSGGLATELNSRLRGGNLASKASEVVPRLAGASAIVYAVRASSSQTPCLWLCDQWGGIVPIVQNTDMASLAYDSTNLRFILTNNSGGYINFGYVFLKTYS